VVDIGAAGTLLLGAAYGVMLMVKQPARRVRIAEAALLGCLMLLIVQAVPIGGAARISLGVVEAGRPMRLPWFENERVAAASEPRPSGSDQSRHMTAQSLPDARGSDSHMRLLWICGYWRELLLAFYSLGVAVMLGRLLLAWWGLRRLRQQGQPATGELAASWRELTSGAPHGNAGLWRGIGVELLISEEVGRPMTFGVGRTVVVLPRYVAEAPPRDIAAVLKHELGHVERRDAWAWTLAAAVNVAMFFVPTLWLVKREMRLAQEFLADRAAIDGGGGGGGGDAVGYAEMLVRLVGKRQAMGGGSDLAMGAWTGRSELLRRVKHLFAVREVLERRATRRWTAAVTLVVLLMTACLGAVTLADTSLKSQVRAAELRGVSFLLAKQEPNGGWLTQMGPAPTALVVRSLLQAGVPPEHHAIVRARAFVAECQRADGGYYTDGEPTYQTAVVMSMYAALGGGGDADAMMRVEDGRRFLQQEMERPTKAAGNWYQNSSPSSLLSSRPFADPTERAADAVLETYGSLTYAKWKSLVYAGLKETDPHVLQAAKWVQEHWTLEKHPGTGSTEGLYYYYLAAARTLKAAKPLATGSAGDRDRWNWRGELSQKLLHEQSPDGSWVNHLSARWLEDRPEMVTAYALLALQETR